MQDTPDGFLAYILPFRKAEVGKSEWKPRGKGMPLASLFLVQVYAQTYPAGETRSERREEGEEVGKEEWSGGEREKISIFSKNLKKY